MPEPRFISKAQVLRFHKHLIEAFGGPSSAYDEGLLESALHAPQHLYVYNCNNADIFDLAACYLEAVARNHAFIDGNKRVAATCALAFLKQNEIVINIDNRFLVELIISLIKRERDTKFAAECLFVNIDHIPITYQLSKFIGGEELISQYSHVSDMEEWGAIATDYITSKSRVFFTQYCEKYVINPNRFSEFIINSELFLYKMVTEKWRIQFGMALPPTPKTFEK
ncbi:MAG: type II toxin-antitoxin system death-on-curing family toxin [Candidatus Methylacidiphilales bacterium]|nr:type II toxin-antitoxin system death-on-curing family toxin [Candidatus Methylacidiphilales bacterium]